jgi:hypothetical protein
VYPGNGALVNVIKKQLKGHLKLGWYPGAAEVVTKVAAVVADRRWPPSSSPPSPDSSLGTVKEEDLEVDPVVYEILEHRENAFADKATVIRHTLAERFGKADAKVLLSQCKEIILTKASGGKQRMLMLNGQALRLKR